MGQFFLLEQIAPSPAAHARSSSGSSKSLFPRKYFQRTCCKDFRGCRAGKMAFKIPEIVRALGPQLNVFMAVGILLKNFPHKLLQFE